MRRPDNVWLLGLLEQYNNGITQKDVARSTMCRWIKRALAVKMEIRKKLEGEQA